MANSMKNNNFSNTEMFQNGSLIEPVYYEYDKKEANSMKNEGITDLKTGTYRTNYEELSNYILQNNKLIKLDGNLYVYIKNFGYYAPITDGKFGFDIRQLLPYSSRGYLNSNNIAEIITWLNFVVVNEVNQDLFFNFLNFSNGIYDITNNTFFNHSSEIPFTYKLNIPYLPNYQYPTPYFDNFINNITHGDNTIKEILLDSLAYVICNARLIKKIIILYGPSNTGKSVFLNILQAIIGHEFTTCIPLEYIGDRFRTIDLMGSRLNTFSEMGNQKLKNINILKALSGNDFINCDIKNGQPTNFKNRAALVFSTNSLEPLKVNDPGQAFYKRLTVIPFLYQTPPDKQNPNLTNLILNELPNIVKKYIIDNGRLKYYINNNFQFMSDSLSEKIKFDLFNMTNSIQLFIGSCCRFGNGRIYSETLYSHYVRFCAKKGFYPETKHCLCEYIESLAINDFNNIPITRTRYRDNNGNNKRGFNGIEVICSF